MIGRRLLLGSMGALAASRASRAQPQSQPGGLPRIAYCATRTPNSFRLEAFLQGMAELGYHDGETIEISYHWAETADRLPQMAAEAVAAGPDVIVAIFTSTVLALMQETRTIPIVFSAVSDPIASGMAASLNRPGGNLTGLSLLATDVVGKRLSMLQECIDGLRRVAVVYSPDNAGGILSMEEAVRVGPALGLEVVPVPFRISEDIASLFAGLASEGVQAVVLVAEFSYTAHFERFAQAALADQLPIMSDFRELPLAGGLMSYGTNLPAHFRRAAYYVDRILHGASPAELPVEQPTVFDMVINLRTAHELGLTVPPTLLVFATEIIE